MAKTPYRSFTTRVGRTGDAWWALAGALPPAEGLPHPTLADLRAFYVGISPARAGTKQRLRGRVVSNHIGGNTDGSTFRFALASLLREEMGYRPRLKVDSKGRQKYILPPDQNDDLRTWQAQNLRVIWTECDEPWRPGLEGAVIEHFKPPLNSAENTSHPFHATLKAARAAFRASAVS